MPTCSSPGRTTTRPSDVGAQQQHRRRAPASTAAPSAGRARRSPAPTCGTARPTNAIGPAPRSRRRTAATIATARQRPGCGRRWRRARGRRRRRAPSAFSGRAERRGPARAPTTRNGSTLAAARRGPRPASEPTRPEAELVEACRRPAGATAVVSAVSAAQHRGAGQRQPHRRRARRARRAERVDHREATRGAGEGEPDVPGSGARRAAEIAEHHRGGGAGVDAEDARVGERVAGQRLHQRAGQPERAARPRARRASAARAARARSPPARSRRRGAGRRRLRRAGSPSSPTATLTRTMNSSASTSSAKPAARVRAKRGEMVVGRALVSGAEATTGAI